MQVAWCYMWLVHPYVTTALYIHGRERMPFQGRLLMALVMRWASESKIVGGVANLLTHHKYWFPNAVHPDVIAQAAINIACLAIAGIITVRIYRAASQRQILEPLVYPLVLVLVVVTYMLHTIQNYRFVYDLPSLAFFALALETLYFRRSRWWFAAIFVLATTNRETSLLMLVFYVFSQTTGGWRLDWRRLFEAEHLTLLLALGGYWIGWQWAIHRAFHANASEFYPRIPLNLSFFISPGAWPQLLSVFAYVIPFLFIYRDRLRDTRLRGWLRVLPIWFAFMFVYGILIETRIFGELIPYVACVGVLIGEELIASKLLSTPQAEEESPTDAIAAD